MRRILLARTRRIGRRHVPLDDALRIDLVERTLRRDGTTVRSPGLRTFRLITAVAFAPGILDWSDCEDFVYGDDETGGPIDVRSVLHLMKMRANAQLAVLDIRMAAATGLGLELLDLRAEARVAA